MSTKVNGWHTLRPIIKAKLETIDDFAFVDDKFTNDIAGYPCIMFEPADDPSEFSTNQTDLHQYTFNLYLLQEMESIGRDEAIRILSQAVDAVTYAFLNDDSLGGACLYSKPIPSEWSEFTIGEGMVKSAKLSLKCFVLHQIS